MPAACRERKSELDEKDVYHWYLRDHIINQGARSDDRGLPELRLERSFFGSIPSLTFLANALVAFDISTNGPVDSCGDPERCDSMLTWECAGKYPCHIRAEHYDKSSRTTSSLRPRHPGVRRSHESLILLVVTKLQFTGTMLHRVN
jgi:hypothetical protein